MGDSRAFDQARLLLQRGRTLLSGRLAERLRHVVWAALVAFGMYLVLLLEPADQFLWLVQSKIADRDPSGEIVFVSADFPLNETGEPENRIKLARTLDELDRLGVGKVYLDIPFNVSIDPAADQRLATAISDLGPRLTLVDRFVVNPLGAKTLRSSDPRIAGEATRVVSDQTDLTFMGYAWTTQYTYKIGERPVRSFGAALGNVNKLSPKSFSIDYGFDGQKIPSIEFEEIFAERDRNASRRSKGYDLSGKTVVIGHSQNVPGFQQRVPGRRDAPASYVDIYAGETLKSGRTGFIRGNIAIILAAGLLAALLTFAQSRKRRWAGYALISAILPIALLGGAKFGFRVELAYPFAVLISFGIMRWRSRWKRRVAMINQDTGLPTLRALEARLVRDSIGEGHVVIAKIQNYERVLKTLRAQDKSKYLLKVVDRLRATDAGLAIYADGHYLGWYEENDKAEALVEHLEGLRAMFAAPVQVVDLSVDVGITFGIASLEGDPRTCVPAALAAAEETSEALRPIAVAERDTETDLLWDISLRARIDEAMEAGEIYCVYQPKISLVDHHTSGVEALVRWHDPSRGFISPMHFIQQCEKAGRMEHLTRYVLQSACSAGQLLHFRGQHISMSVNISATLLGDMRIVGIVRNVLQATRFDPRYLTLEITETARIADLANAACIIEEMRALGVKISMDDFGMGAANYEAFYQLPFDEVKIDRTFVASIATDPKAKAIVASIVQMGRDARITVVAEGLEDPEDVNLLKELGCEQVQGFAFSRPLSLANLLEFQNISKDASAANMV